MAEPLELVRKLDNGTDQEKLAAEQFYAAAGGNLPKAHELALQRRTQVTCTRCNATFLQGAGGGFGTGHNCKLDSKHGAALKAHREAQARAAARKRAEFANCPDCKQPFPPAGQGHACKWVDPLYRNDEGIKIKKLEADLEALKASVKASG